MAEHHPAIWMSRRLVAVTWSVSGGLIPNALAKVLVVYCGLLLVVVFSLFHVYQPWQKAGSMRQVRKLAAAWVPFWWLQSHHFAAEHRGSAGGIDALRAVCIGGFNLWALLVFGGLSAVTRTVVHAGMGVLRRRGYNRQRAIIVGAGDTGRKLARYLVTKIDGLASSWPVFSMTRCRQAQVINPERHWAKSSELSTTATF
jgi:FlaA1/EpsC-like NDP-sugar epimerase